MVRVENFVGLNNVPKRFMHGVWPSPAIKMHSGKEFFEQRHSVAKTMQRPSAVVPLDWGVLARGNTSRWRGDAH